MESIALFEEKISINPRDFSKNKIDILDLLHLKLKSKLEGRCSLHGWVLHDTIKILSRSMGYIEKGRYTGDIVYHVQAEGKVINPPSDVILSGVVIRKNKMGMYVNYNDAIHIILPRDLHVGNEEYENVEINDNIIVEIKKSRFQVNDEHIISVGLFLKKGTYTQTQTQTASTNDVDDVDVSKPAVDVPKPPLVNSTVSATVPPPVSATAPIEPTKTSNEPTTTSNEPTTTSNEPISFYGKDEPFSNFYNSPFSLDGKIWPTVEHYFQAMKFTLYPEYQELIRTAKTSAAAKTLGSTKEKTIRADWDSVREDIMRKALGAKFEQNPLLKQKLLDTGDRELIEASPSDAYWGIGKTKKGQNRLGVLLMELRNKFRG